MDQLVVRPIRIEGEALFQRWRLGVYRILGRCPRLATANPFCGGLSVTAARLWRQTYPLTRRRKREEPSEG